MQWSDEASKTISKVPFFIRKRVKRKVEEEAAGAGARQVTMEHVRASQKRFLNRMEDEVKGYQIETCFGPSGCPNRAVEYDGLIEDLENQLSKRNLKAFLKKKVNGPLKMHHEFRISISDCPNACSRPQIADIGIIGACAPAITDMGCDECGACVDTCKEEALFLNAGRPFIHPEKCIYCGQCARVCPTGTLTEGQKGFRIQVGGKLGRHPRLATEIPGIHTPQDIPKFIDRCLDYYQTHCQKGERFGEMIEKNGVEELWIA
ncbi:MAG: 4Fe-4S binding protein [Deltaproteobacteria bacterium]|nr:4Fe-4S binding protein [Deltaproteobacteria bacterium]